MKIYLTLIADVTAVTPGLYNCPGALVGDKVINASQLSNGAVTTQVGNTILENGKLITLSGGMNIDKWLVSVEREVQ